MKSFYLISILLPFLFSCEKPEKETPEGYFISPGYMMMVVNEGNFRSGNASVDLYNTGTGKWLYDAFKSLNNRALGDVCQSATLWNDKWFIVVNNSGKIEVVNPSDFKSVRTITGLRSPRYLLPVSGTKAYVSDLYANKIWILSGSEPTISGSIAAVGWTEEMILVGDQVWVVNKRRPVIHIIDSKSDVMVDSLMLPAIPTSIAKSSGNLVWIGTDSTTSQRSKIYLVDASSKTIEQSISPIFSKAAPESLIASFTGDTLFFISGGPCMVNRFNSSITLFNNSKGNWYGLGYDPKTRLLIASDAKDFNQKSSIWKKFLNTNQELEEKGGIITSHFYFF